MERYNPKNRQNFSRSLQDNNWEQYNISKWHCRVIECQHKERNVSFTGDYFTPQGAGTRSERVTEIYKCTPRLTGRQLFHCNHDYPGQNKMFKCCITQPHVFAVMDGVFPFFPHGVYHALNKVIRRGSGVTTAARCADKMHILNTMQ